MPRIATPHHPPSTPSTRRHHLLALAALAGAACALPSAPARAQAWPAKPVTIVVPFAAGGTTDVRHARWAKNWAQPWASL